MKQYSPRRSSGLRGTENEQHSPSWLRTRLSIFQHFIQGTPYREKEKGNDLVLLRNGVLPKHDPVYYDLEERIRGTSAAVSFPDNPLSFSEITRFNTWFELHPEKVFGKEIISTSREFPITIKGGKEDVVAGFSKALRKQDNTRTSTRRNRTKIKARALALELELMTF